MSRTKFQIGEAARHIYSGAVHTVTWVSKCGELIATELNGYCHPYSDALCYSKVQGA